VRSWNLIGHLSHQRDLDHILRIKAFATMNSFQALSQWKRSWKMVTPIDAFATGMGFDKTGRWHEARTRFMPVPTPDDDVMAPARGAIYGLLGGGLLWFGLIVVARILISLF
jgi:hypothetical protein